MSDNKHLIDNGAFCVLPWIGAYQTPIGISSACCLHLFDKPYHKYHTVDQIVNSKEMSNLRLDMMNGVKHASCKVCYKHERNSQTNSFRKTKNADYVNEVNDFIANTNPDGTLKEVKLKTVDIRFDNLCSMKCRMCSDTFSTMWQSEMVRHDPEYEVVESGIDLDAMMQSIVKQIPNLDEIYFAGGEPLISKYHYKVLNEIVKQGRTDIRLRYNTNLSHLTYQGTNILDIWEQFDDIMLGVSLDHYGERSEYIRHGVKWEQVKDNYLKLLGYDNLQIIISSTINAYNYPTFGDFIEYMWNNNMINDRVKWSALRQTTPPRQQAKNLPPKLIRQGRDKVHNAVDKIKSLPGYCNSHNLDEVKEIFDDISRMNRDTAEWTDFWTETYYLDGLRNENVLRTFPELAEYAEETDAINLRAIRK